VGAIGCLRRGIRERAPQDRRLGQRGVVRQEAVIVVDEPAADREGEESAGRDTDGDDRKPARRAGGVSAHRVATSLPGSLSE
jgi:hypothetical protein